MKNIAILKYVLILSLSLSCFAKEIDFDKKYDFNIFEQSNCIFKLQGYELSKPVEAGICFGVECILETYTDTFGLEFPEGFKVTLIIFDDRDKYNQYFKDKFGTDAIADGYFSLGDNECVVWKNTDVKQMLNVLFHETQHLLMSHHYPNCPMWLNEGLSQYFQGLNVIGKKKRIYVTNDCKQWNVHWLKRGFPVEPKKYVNLDYDQWNELRSTDVTAAYSIGYSMTFFLMEGSHNRKVLKNIVLECQKDYETEDEIIERRGKKYLRKKVLSKPSTEVLGEFYPGGYDEFEKDWRRWIPRSRSYHPVRIMRNKVSNASKSAEPVVYGSATSKKTN